MTAFVCEPGGRIFERRTLGPGLRRSRRLAVPPDDVPAFTVVFELLEKPVKAATAHANRTRAIDTTLARAPWQYSNRPLSA